MMVISDSRRVDAPSPVTPIPLDQLDGEIRKAFGRHEGPRGIRASLSHAVRLLAKIGVADTAGIATDEATARDYLDAWNGSLDRRTIMHMLNALAKVRDFATDRGWRPPSGDEGAPIPIPPDWDRKHPAFAQAGRVVSPGRRYGGTPPEPGELDRFAAYLKAHSRSWEGARLFVAVAILAVGRRRPTEAMGLEASAADDAPMPEVLAELFRRWKPRIGSRWLFPTIARNESWHLTGAGCLGDRLGLACEKAGVRHLTPGALFLCGKDEAEAARLTDPVVSPFRLSPGDGALTLAPTTLGRLRHKMMKRRASTSTRWVRDEAFLALGRLLPDDASTLALTAEVHVPFREEIAAFGPSKRAHVYGYFRTICRRAIRAGRLDLDPSAGRAYPARSRHPGPEKPAARAKGFRVAALAATIAELPTRPAEARPTPWVGTAEELEREILAIESVATRDVVRKLIELMPPRPTGLFLEKQSRHGDAVNLLKTFAASSSRIGKAIGLRGKGKRGYWIEIQIRLSHP